MNKKIAIGLLIGVLSAIIIGHFTGVQKYYYNSDDLYGVNWEVTLDAYLEGMRKNGNKFFNREFEIRRKYDPTITFLAILGGFSISYLLSDLLTKRK